MLLRDDTSGQAETQLEQLEILCSSTQSAVIAR